MDKIVDHDIIISDFEVSLEIKREWKDLVPVVVIMVEIITKSLHTETHTETISWFWLHPFFNFLINHSLTLWDRYSYPKTSWVADIFASSTLYFRNWVAISCQNQSHKQYIFKCKEQTLITTDIHFTCHINCL